jgi:AraC-like DNA-binding protein
MVILADIKHLLHTIILFQCFLLAFYLLNQKTKRRQSNVILAAFLITKGISELEGVLRFFRELRVFLYNSCPHLFYIPTSFNFLYMPLLFFYILSMTQDDFKFKKRYLIHGGLFLLSCIYITFQYLLHSPDLLRQGMSDGYLFHITESHIFNVSGDIQFFVYAIISLHVLHSYHKRLKDSYSTIHHIDLSWLRFVLYGFIVWRSLGVLQNLLWLLINNDCLILLYIASLIVFLFFVSVMVFRGLKQPQIFLGKGINSIGKYDKAILPKDVREKYKQKLIHYMESYKPYIDSELTLRTLSEMMSIPQRHLSHVLNESLKQNFFDFINRYRVDEVKKLLKEPKYQHYTVLAVAFEAGFSSKSSFNLVFKKYTKMTPSQYRKTTSDV